MIQHFIDTCKKKSDEVAFIIGNRRISFQTLLSDVYRMVNCFIQRGIPRGGKALLYLLPSYDFYVLLLACIYYGVNIIVPDSYKDKDRLSHMLQQQGVKQVFCNRLTFFLRKGIPQNTTFIDISDFRKYSDNQTPKNEAADMPVLTTFTSGTTGEPKPIYRSAAFLKKQIESISLNIDITDSQVVFGGLPIYALYAIYHGRTCVIDRKLCVKDLKKHKIDTVFAPIALLLKMKGASNGVRYVYFGGARLYQREAAALRRAFPVAKIRYNYGASECALIGMTELDYYIKNGFVIKETAKDAEVTLVEKDENGVGKIQVKGDCVLTEDKTYCSNDLGYMDEYGLHIVGRSKYSAVGRYNYLIDDEILSKNEKIKKGFSFVYQDKTYFCCEGKLTVRKDGVEFVKFQKLPMDGKHKTKLNYHKTIGILSAKNK